MQLNLAPHPATPPSEPFKVWVNVEHSAAFSATATTNIWFGIGAPASRFVIPEPVEPKRADDLWKTTCFEAFLRVPGAAAYREWNFAPSGEWAAYDFTAYREGRTNADVTTPYIRVEDNFTCGRSEQPSASKPPASGNSASPRSLKRRTAPNPTGR